MILTAAPMSQVTGLPVLIDLDLSHARTDDAPFVHLPEPSLDPRQPAALADEAVVAVSTEADVAGLAAWWGHRVATMSADGVRLLGLDRLPPALVQDFLIQFRREIGGKIVMAWTPGLGWGALAGLPPGTVDFVVSSLPWWDGHAPWVWDELAALRRVAPVIVPSAQSVGRAARWLQLSALLGDGWLGPCLARCDAPAAEVSRLNRLRQMVPSGPAQVISAPGRTLALLRTDAADVRQAGRAAIILVNDAGHSVQIDPAGLLMAAGQDFAPFKDGEGVALDPTAPYTLAAGDLHIFQAESRPGSAPAPVMQNRAVQAAQSPRLALELPSPSVDQGRFPVRRTVGDRVEVEIDIIGDGHDHLAAMLRWQAPGEDTWQETPMRLVNNDRWAGAFPLLSLGVHHYSVVAWRDDFATFTDELTKKHAAGLPLVLELQEGAALVNRTAGRMPDPRFASLIDQLRAPSEEAGRLALLSSETALVMRDFDLRPFAVTLAPAVPVRAERAGAGFAAWYEVFPRSLSPDPARHGTFRDVIHHLPRIQAMGFDVLYFPPIHPIGRKNRKGRNNSLTPTEDDPGSPYAIGSPEGGHDALHGELGSFEDFQALRAAAADHGMEIALDFAIQCSPDHPWLSQHKEWFTWRPDGSIKYAENPPKKYEDIVNVDFYAKGAVPSLWMEWCRVVLFWAEQGVRLFRVDNPHTKPLPFWEWMIGEVQERYPDTVFLAEAFTRPKVMYRLAKCGFSQSYTYFTWRDQKWEFTQYLDELTQGPAREFFRPHFFVNTPDINPVYLQNAGRAEYVVRAALAATLSGLWGLYNGFELCEGTPVPGREEYLDSEKYQLRAWDWDRPGNIVAEITQLNRIRRANPALHTHLGLTFLPASGDRVLFFEKATRDRGNVVLVAISLDASSAQSATLELPFWRYPSEPAALAVTDALRGQRWTWRDRRVDVTLPPERPFAIWLIEPET